MRHTSTSLEYNLGNLNAYIESVFEYKTNFQCKRPHINLSQTSLVGNSRIQKVWSLGGQAGGGGMQVGVSYLD